MLNNDVANELLFIAKLINGNEIEINSSDSLVEQFKKIKEHNDIATFNYKKQDGSTRKVRIKPIYVAINAVKGSDQDDNNAVKMFLYDGINDVSSKRQMLSPSSFDILKLPDVPKNNKENYEILAKAIKEGKMVQGIYTTIGQRTFPIKFKPYGFSQNGRQVDIETDKGKKLRLYISSFGNPEDIKKQQEEISKRTYEEEAKRQKESILKEQAEIEESARLGKFKFKWAQNGIITEAPPYKLKHYNYIISFPEQNFFKISSPKAMFITDKGKKREYDIFISNGKLFASNYPLYEKDNKFFANNTRTGEIMSVDESATSRIKSQFDKEMSRVEREFSEEHNKRIKEIEKLEKMMLEEPDQEIVDQFLKQGVYKNNLINTQRWMNKDILSAFDSFIANKYVEQETKKLELVHTNTKEQLLDSILKKIPNEFHDIVKKMKPNDFARLIHALDSDKEENFELKYVSTRTGFHEGKNFYVNYSGHNPPPFPQPDQLTPNPKGIIKYKGNTFYLNEWGYDSSG